MSMGFRLDRTYVLEFEGDLLGLEVKIRATPISVVERMRVATGQDWTELLAEYVQEWNYEDAKGNPLSIDASSISENMEEVVVVAICREWFKAAVGVTAPLDIGSTPIGQNLESSIPMEMDPEFQPN